MKRLWAGMLRVADELGTARAVVDLRRVALLSALLPAAASGALAAGAPGKEVRAEAPSAVVFADIGAASGIEFRHGNGATPDKHMPETMGAGGLLFDYDGDGWLDLLLVDGGSLVDDELAGRARTVLYRNDRDGTFTDVTATAAIRHRDYGMGACAADYDNDGWVDLYLTRFGGNVLYRNDGDGTFTDVTARAAVGSRLWSASCAFGDIDNDGDVDLYVTNYVDFSVAESKYCGDHIANIRAYCHPNVFSGQTDTLYRNEGNGTFTDVSKEAGVYTTVGKGLGVVFGDYDDDGRIDIYVANDSVPNFLYRNLGEGRFEETALLAGVAVNGQGQPEAGMGTDMADFDGDGQLDLFVTNLDMETNTLYRSTGDGFFEDVTVASGQGEPSLRFVGFGAAFLDYDNDADLDVVVANGHILDNASQFRDNITYAQRNLLYRNDGAGRFTEVSRISGAGFEPEKVSRAVAFGDIDNDGDVDLLFTNNGQTPDLLRNDGGHDNHALLVRTIGVKSNRDGIGARLKLTAGGETQLREVKAGSSYLTQNDLRVHFGLGAAARADRLEVRWPSGRTESIDGIEGDHIVTIREGDGVIAREPFAGRRPESDEAAGENKKAPVRGGR